MKTIVNYIFLFVLSITLAGLGTYFAIGLVTDSAQEIIVPKLEGSNIINVLETLTNMGLNPKLKGTRFHAELPRYTVISQEPAPGTVIKKGRDVVLYISKGLQMLTMPDLRQLPLDQAEILLEENELKLNALSHVFTEKAGKNKIISQYPASFSQINKGQSCDLLVSRGTRPNEFTMPDFIGKPLSEVLTFCKIKKLTIETIHTQHSDLHEDHAILKQNPETGKHVNNFTPISLIVNTNKPAKAFTKRDFSGVVMVSYKLDPGFLKKHVQIKAPLFGTDLELFNEHVLPGKEVGVLIPAGIQTKVDIFVDNKLIETRYIDPWHIDY